MLSEYRIHPDSKSRTTSLLAKIREWNRICRRNGASCAALLWHESFYQPLRRRLGLLTD